MKYVRFLDGGAPHYGSVEGDEVAVMESDLFDSPVLTGVRWPLKGLPLLTPCSPSKVVGIGLNYRDHASEVGAVLPDEPRIFFKPPTSLLAHGAEIVWPRSAQRVDYEAELVAVIGRRAKDVSSDDALSYVFGYTCGNDVTARDLQVRDKLPDRAKGFDTFGPFGPVIVTDLDPTDLKLECVVNGRTRQAGTTADMIFGVAKLVSFLSEIMTLLPGDVIFTGTPRGIGSMEPGDVVEVTI